MSTLRLTGLMSGMDTDSIIKDLMKIETMKVDKQYKTAAKLNYKVDAYKSVNSKLESFYRKFATATNGGMLASATYKSFNVKYTNNERGAVTVSGTGEAASGSHKFGVAELAEKAKVQSGADIGRVSPKTKLKDLEIFKDMTYTKAVSGVIYEKDSNGKPVADSNGVYKTEGFTYDEFMQFGIEYTDKDGNTQQEFFTFSQNDTIEDMVNKVNANKDTGVVMRYSQIDDKFTFESRETGAQQSVKVIEGTSDEDVWLKSTGLSSYEIENYFVNTNTKDQIFDGGTYVKDEMLDKLQITPGVAATGKDSVVFVDDIRMTSSSNTYKLDGIVFTANKTTGATEAEAMDNSVEFNLEQNVDQTVEKITEFINEYNELVKELAALTGEKTYRDYQPLTDEERSALTEKQQEDWDKKAKSGILRNDSQLQSLLTTLRSAFYSDVTGPNSNMADIGLTTSANYSEGGTIEINESKLKEALQSDPDKVLSMFTQLSKSKDEKTYNNESGVVYRIKDAMYNYKKFNEETSLNMVQDQYKTATEKWMDLTDKLADIEENYYIKFAAMEKAMAKMQSQLSALSGMMGSR